MIPGYRALDVCRVTDEWCAEHARQVVARLNAADRRRRQYEDDAVMVVGCILGVSVCYCVAWLASVWL